MQTRTFTFEARIAFSALIYTGRGWHTLLEESGASLVSWDRSNGRLLENAESSRL